jgi:dephospho-CoA kinase
MLATKLYDIRSAVKAGDALPVVALEAAIKIEAGWTDLVSILRVIHMDRDVVKGLLMTRNKLSAEVAKKNRQRQYEKKVSATRKIAGR